MLARIIERKSQVLGATHWGWLGLAIAVWVGAQILSALRWALLSQPLQLNSGWQQFLALYFLGAFFNVFLPTVIGGDFVKAYYLARDTRRVARATTSVFIDRDLGLGGLLVSGCVAATLSGTTLPGVSLAAILWLLLAGYFAANIVLLSRRMHDLVRWLLCHRWLERLTRQLDALLESLAIYRDNLGRMTMMAALSVGIHLVSFVAVFFVGSAIGATVALKHYPVFIP